MAEITSTLENFPGHIELPEPDDFSGVMFDDYQTIVENLQKNHPGLSKLMHLNAYACAAFVAKGHGKWKIDGVTLDEFRGWVKDREAERVQLVAVVGRKWAEYFREIISPNG